MKILELFAGSRSFSKAAESLGMKTFTTDIEPFEKIDYVVDVMDFDPSKVPFKPDIIWASPPCTTFSVASLSHYWLNGKPKNEKALQGIRILDKAVELIKTLEPKLWYIENPRAMMRKVIDEIFSKYGIINYKRNTVSYCQYGLKIMKPTDIWTNDFGWTPKPICKAGAPCHERASRGSRTGVQGIYNLKWEQARGGTAMARGVIPEELCLEILESKDE
jgi:hypothetical protein